jgi:hypothetical protein
VDSGFAGDVLLVGAGVRAAGPRRARNCGRKILIEFACRAHLASGQNHVASIAELGVQGACQIMRSHSTDLFGIAKRAARRVASTRKTVPLRYTRSSNQERKWTG